MRESILGAFEGQTIMEPARVLVVYYTRSGNTRRVVDAIVEAIDCDIEAIVESDGRLGIGGYVRSVLDGLLARPARIGRMQQDPAAYDVIIVGTPIWGQSIATPVRAWLEVHGAKAHQIALFCTYKSGMGDRPVSQLKSYCGKDAVAFSAVSETELRSGPMLGIRVRNFLRSAGLQENMTAKAQADRAPQESQPAGTGVAGEATVPVRDAAAVPAESFELQEMVLRSAT